VYFECGAKVDVVDVQGLVLSPGFPYNYSSGTHCVWQFFVPVGHQLTMEMLDFDVFESSSSPGSSLTTSASTLEEGEENPGSSVGLLFSKVNLATGQNVPKEPRHSEEVKQVVVQEESNKMEMAKVSNSAKRPNESPSAMPPPSQLLSAPQPPGDKAQNSVSPLSSRTASEPKARSASVLLTTPTAMGRDDAVSPDTQQSVMDACPHDVLYISDLVAFSARFCGSNRPSSNQLVFGSELEMVEVIMELITTTHWGRGFALLFRYHNLTQVAATGGQRSLAPSGGAVDVLLAVVSGAAFFAMALASILCMILRGRVPGLPTDQRPRSWPADRSEATLLACRLIRGHAPGLPTDQRPRSWPAVRSEAVFLACRPIRGRVPGLPNVQRPRSWPADRSEAAFLTCRPIRGRVPDLPTDQRPRGHPQAQLAQLGPLFTGGFWEADARSCGGLPLRRPKLCAKGSNTTSSINSEVPEGAPNPGADGSELQLVAANHAEQKLVPEQDNPVSQPHTGSVSGGCDVSQNAELQCSDGLTELELGTDEVFVISPGPNSAGPAFSPHTQHERFLRHSDTGPCRPSDWPTPDSSALSTVSRGGHVGSAVSARPRAWSVRTFHDFLPPLPQLHKKWCSWNSTSPFTKLVDSGSPSSPSDGRDDVRTKVLSDGHLQDRGTSCKSESSMSTASYPLSHSAQRQRRLNSTSNLRRARFNAPCFGLLSTSPESSKPQGGANGTTTASHQLPEPSSTLSGQQQKTGEAAAGDSSMSYGVRSHPSEDDHVSVPVFAISEEDDRQPLVSAEDLVRPSMVNGQSYESPNRPLGSAHSATPLTTEETKMAVLKNSKIQLPSLSQATLQCSSVGKDM
ncbi:hypothetical protein NFI96_025210, partial [Prochilodus magdalenae]